MKRRLWTIDDVSEYLNVKKATLYSWVRNGTIPAYKIGGALRFNPIDIERIVEDSKVTPTSIDTLRKKSPKNQDIDSIVKKAIEEGKGHVYNTSKRKTMPSSGSQVRRF